MRDQRIEFGRILQRIRQFTCISLLLYRKIPIHCNVNAVETDYLHCRSAYCITNIMQFHILLFKLHKRMLCAFRQVAKIFGLKLCPVPENQLVKQPPAVYRIENKSLH